MYSGLLFVTLIVTSLILNTLGIAIQKESNAKDQVLTQKLPEAIIIGSKKCGTRALLKFIGAHPNVSAAGAEVHFFDRFYHMGQDWYRDQMPLSSENQITIEKTPKYFVDKHAPRRVYRMNPKIKLIVVLRDPVERTISEYVQSRENRLKKRAAHRRLIRSHYTLNDSAVIHQMIYDENNDIKLEKPMIRNSLYASHLKNWLKYFPLEQFVFINGATLVKSPSTEMNKLETFLELPQIFTKDHFIHNKRKGFPCIYKPLNSDNIKCLNEMKGRKHPIVSNKILADLHNLYEPYNQQFFNMINQKSWWD